MGTAGGQRGFSWGSVVSRVTCTLESQKPTSGGSGLGGRLGEDESRQPEGWAG